MRVACRAAGDAIRVDLSVRPPALRRRTHGRTLVVGGAGAVRAGAAARAAGDGGRMGGRWWRCCASWCARGGVERALWTQRRTGAAPHSTAHRFNLGPPSASRPVFIGTIRKFVRASAQCARSRRPALRRVRARAAASAPARRRQTVGRRAPHTPAAVAAHARSAQPNTVGARRSGISETIELTTYRTHPP
jgi:hypothetical protein